jgi:Glycosyltransferase family 25 (LPS biosynthesis protein)
MSLFIIVVLVIVILVICLHACKSTPRDIDQEKARLHNFEIMFSDAFSSEQQDRLHKYYAYIRDVTTKMPRTNFRDVISYPVYYINMDKHKYRRAFIENQIKDYNIQNTCRIAGVDVRNPAEAMQLEWGYPNEPEPHKKGCISSHIRAIRTAYDRNDSIALIVEDDVHFGLLGYVNFSLPDLVKVAPIDWQLISLHTPNCNLRDHQYYDSKLRFIYRVDTSKRCWSTCAYLITRSAMRDILNLVTPDPTTFPENIRIRPLSPGFPEFGVADAYLFDILRTYYVSPSLVYPYWPDDMLDGQQGDTKRGWTTEDPPKLIGIPDIHPV